jgi:hypothetical protein
VALLAAAALALGACGGDDGGNGSGTTDAASPDFTTNSGTGTTGTTERERTGTTEDRTTKTRESGDDSGGSSGRNGGSGSSGSSKSGSGGNDDSGSKAQPNPQPGNVAKIAEKVCNSFLPKQISRALEQDKTSPEDVARDYSRGFPEKQRESAYEGCLAGLKKR